MCSVFFKKGKKATALAIRAKKTMFYRFIPALRNTEIATVSVASKESKQTSKEYQNKTFFFPQKLFLCCSNYTNKRKKSWNVHTVVFSSNFAW